MTKPGAATCGSEGMIAVPGEQECYHVELTASRSTSVSRPPRSIPDGEAALISVKARSRTKGELFPSEDDGDALPEICPFTEGKPMVSPHLSESQRTQIGLVLEEFSDCFSDGKSIGHVRGYSVPINTGKNPPAPTPGTETHRTCKTQGNRYGHRGTPEVERYRAIDKSNCQPSSSSLAKQQMAILRRLPTY